MENSQVTKSNECFGYPYEIQAKIVAMLLFDEATFGELEDVFKFGIDGNFAYVWDKLSEFARYKAMCSALIDGADNVRSKRD